MTDCQKGTAHNPLDLPEIRAPNQTKKTGDLGETVAALALQHRFPNHQLVQIKADGVTGPDMFLIPLNPADDIIPVEVKTIRGGAMRGNLASHLSTTKNGRQASGQYLNHWVNKNIRGEKDK